MIQVFYLFLLALNHSNQIFSGQLIPINIYGRFVLAHGHVIQDKYDQCKFSKMWKTSVNMVLFESHKSWAKTVFLCTQKDDIQFYESWDT
jgi:hypothetical protein